MLPPEIGGGSGMDSRDAIAIATESVSAKEEIKGFAPVVAELISFSVAMETLVTKLAFMLLSAAPGTNT
jgi:hypothetical protein